MEQFDVLEYLRKLRDWKTQSPATLYAILDQIGSQNLSNNRATSQRLIQAVQSLSELDLQKGSQIYKTSEYKRVIDKAKATLKILKSSQTMEIEKDKQIKKYNIFNDYQQQFTGYVVDRLPNLNLISNLILNKLKSWSQLNKEQIHSIDRIKEVTIGLEKEIYLKNMFKETRKMAYEMDIRTLVQFMKRDKNGDVIVRVFNKSLTYAQAAQLKSEDWIDENTKQHQIEAQKAELEINQIGFYKEVSKREMDGVEGKECKGCHQKKVYLIEEKQTRCADEPTTKFFECFNCGDKFRI